MRQRVHSLRAGAAGAHGGCKERRERRVRPALREWPIGVFLLQTVTPGFTVADACHTGRSAERRRHRRCWAAAARNLAALLFQLLQPDQPARRSADGVKHGKSGSQTKKRYACTCLLSGPRARSGCGLAGQRLHKLRFRKVQSRIQKLREGSRHSWSCGIRRWALGAGRWER